MVGVDIKKRLSLPSILGHFDFEKAAIMDISQNLAALSID
jgi:hypothetical protein